MAVPYEFNRGFLSPNAQGRYRSESNVPPVSLIRKRCSCGAVVTARQLKQYGACDRRVKVAA